MRIFRTQHHQPGPQGECGRRALASGSPAPRAGHHQLHWRRFTWKSAREAIACSRALLDRTRVLPGPPERGAEHADHDSSGANLERSLALRLSCQAIQRANHRTLQRAERALEHSTLLISKAEKLAARAGPRRSFNAGNVAPR